MAKITETVSIRVTPEQKQRVVDLANGYEKSITEMVMLLVDHAYDNPPVFKVKRWATIPPRRPPPAAAAEAVADV